MKQGKAKGYRVAGKDDAGSSLQQGPFSSVERAEQALRVLLATFGGADPKIGRAVAWKIYPVYQGRSVPWHPVMSRDDG
ncbi:hypothetical protein ELI38_01400 [Rhizobium leguminosarum]|jgi:hypothetical protein|uniref:hypothetical protein n=1 Tax=Rhizobium leguminosarum TaxID=384 RepID=UPI0010318859|nr:hypothetical protein [Rhizobium leguminosarum]TAU94745.1 hypothetical protein ELI38_01400 [Rhizobium leguminosarum]TAV09205.1 hypothetical protein ELI37_01030 [Rhizobium leguminosarum]TAW50122.1 hypothetical protein ELI14_01405 [Rhizobium leguminosarum]TAX48994.1 hypothetical protein ELH99_01485 [Rhizobium leguminosarum]TAZ60022.1 hypothetical protein ELH75_01610 [Rhizobium leguminosarum]